MLSSRRRLPACTDCDIPPSARHPSNPSVRQEATTNPNTGQHKHTAPVRPRAIRLPSSAPMLPGTRTHAHLSGAAGRRVSNRAVQPGRARRLCAKTWARAWQGAWGKHRIPVPPNSNNNNSNNAAPPARYNALHGPGLGLRLDRGLRWDGPGCIGWMRLDGCDWTGHARMRWDALG